MTEREIHDEFKKWLRERQIPFVESRMDRKSTIAKSWPDFTVCWMSRVVLIEVKSSVGRLGHDQVKMIEYIKRSGNKVEIARSVRECVEAVNTILCEGKRCTAPPGGCNYPLEECFRELKRAVAAVPVDWRKDLSDTRVQRGGKPPAAQVERESNAPSVSGADQRRRTAGERTTAVKTQALPRSDSDETGVVTQGRESLANFFIGDWNGKPYVFAPDRDGAYCMIRQASQLDVLNLPRLRD